jgi:hypothetical protein
MRTKDKKETIGVLTKYEIVYGDGAREDAVKVALEGGDTVGCGPRGRYEATAIEGSAAEVHADIVAQRDVLLAACKAALLSMDGDIPANISEEEYTSLVDRLREAIAKAEGK